MNQMRVFSHHRSALACLSGAAVLALSLSSTAVAADEDPRYAALAGLGQLNGVALQCKYIDEMRRMKAAVVRNAPKERSFGLAFDQATNGAFLRFIEQQESCPHPEDFTRRVDQRIDVLRAVFTADR